MMERKSLYSIVFVPCHSILIYVICILFIFLRFFSELFSINRRKFTVAQSKYHTIIDTSNSHNFECTYYGKVKKNEEKTL